MCTVMPDNLRDAVEALDHPVRVKIVEHLYDGHEATYTELLRMLGVRKGSLTYHLNMLTRAAVVDALSRLDEGFGDPRRAYYVLSPWGRAVVDGLMSSYERLVERGGAVEARQVVRARA